MIANSRINTQSGIGLIEVIVALLVFAFGALSAVNSQIISLSGSNTAETHSTVNTLTHEMLEILKADSVRALSNTYDIDFEEAEPLASDSSLVTELVVDWRSRVLNELPDGVGRIECDPDSCEVSLRWREAALNGEDTQTYNLKSFF